MSRSKKPAIFVAILLCAFIVLPLLLLMIFRGPQSAGSSQVANTPVEGDGLPESSAPSVENRNDFDSKKLFQKAKSLLEGGLADALRKGDLSLAQMVELQKRFERAQSDLSRGKTSRAKEGLSEIIRDGEAILHAREIAEKARSMNAETYAELERLDSLKPAFENTYRDAVERYNAALAQLNSSQFEQSIEGFQMVEAILGDLEARSIQRVATLSEAADSALSEFRLSEARQGYESVLKVDPSNVRATEGLVSVNALEGITEQVQVIRDLAKKDELKQALADVEKLVAANPHNTFLKKERERIQASLVDRDFKNYIVSADSADEDGDYPLAIESLKKALALRADAEQARRLVDLEKKYQAVKLDALLTQGFAALKAGRNEEARSIYRKAVKLAPKSEEARNGLEKASSLYLAQIRYTQNIDNTDKYMKEGRFPLAGTFFNKAMASRPTNLTNSQQKREGVIREELERQSKAVTVKIKSDKKTYVSLIGVLPPDRFKETELNLFPDVYTLKGARSGYQTVEIQLKVDATKPNSTVEVVAHKKR